MKWLAAMVVAFALVSPARAEPKGTPRPAPIRAPTSADEIALDAREDEKRDEMIDELTAILPRIPEGERKGDLWFQLAELWWEKARLVSLQEGRAHDEAVGRWAEARRKDPEGAGEEPRMETSRSAALRQKALADYRVVLERYPSYPRRDEVLFVVAYNLGESGKREEAARTYERLIREFPASRFVPDAWVQLGEHRFQSNDLERARAAFEKAASFRLPKLYPFALYKLAWCDYNAGAFDAAIDKFKQVVAYAEEQAARGKEGARDRIQLGSEALKDIVLAWAQIDVVDDAVAYLSQHGEEQGIPAIDRLAATYSDIGKFDKAIAVYQILRERAPLHARAPSWQQKILLAWDKLHRRDLVAGEVRRLVSDYGPDTAWAKANAASAGAIGEATDLAEGALRDLVQDYHQEAIKTKSVATYRLARDIYRQYLDKFPRSEASVSMRFYYAEILYALEEWDAAAAQYTAVAGTGGPHATKAAYNAILALEKSVAVAKGKLRRRELDVGTKIDERRAKGGVDRTRTIERVEISKDQQGEDIPENERRLVAACERYLWLAPGSKDEIVIRYKAALVYYDHRHFVEAARRFGEIILRWPTDSWSQKAASLSFDILETKQQWGDLAELATRFAADAKLCPPGSKFAREVARIAEGARFKAAMQVYENGNDPARAGGEFQRFISDHPASEHAPKALWNTLAIADRADQLDVAIAAGEQLLRDYPAAPAEVIELAVPALASAYERVGRYREAATRYEDAATRWPKDQRAADWLFNAGVWREGLGDEEAAIADWKKYVNEHGDRADVARIDFGVGLLLDRRKEWRRAADHWAAFQRRRSRSATTGQLLLARYQEALALRELRDPGSTEALQDVWRRFQQVPEQDRVGAVADAAAHARLLAIEPAFEAFQKVHFNYTRVRDLTHVLKVKNDRLDKLLQAYADVLRAGSAKWSVAALTRIGDAYRNFNKGLLDAPTPRGLDPEQQELYRNTLESQALPLEDKAVEAFRKAVDTAQKAQALSEWSLLAQDRLRELQPDSFGEQRQPAIAGFDLWRPVAPDLKAALGAGGD